MMDILLLFVAPQNKFHFQGKFHTVDTWVSAPGLLITLSVYPSFYSKLLLHSSFSPLLPSLSSPLSCYIPSPPLLPHPPFVLLSPSLKHPITPCFSCPSFSLFLHPFSFYNFYSLSFSSFPSSPSSLSLEFISSFYFSSLLFLPSPPSLPFFIFTIAYSLSHLLLSSLSPSHLLLLPCLISYLLLNIFLICFPTFFLPLMNEWSLP